jgi:hypothetical protein
MAYGLVSTSGARPVRSIREREARAIQTAGSEGASAGMASGALQGAAQGAGLGATIGTAFLPGVGTAIGLVGGALVGAVAGSIYGVETGENEGEDAKRAELNSKRRTDILTRQDATTLQQQARMGQTSKVKTPRMTAPSATDASMNEMPTASGKGTAYDTWRSTVYGG